MVLGNSLVERTRKAMEERKGVESIVGEIKQ